MPFVKRTDSLPPHDSRTLFIGRTTELHFFKHYILEPEYPAHNIISISGQGGIGKSRLLKQFEAEAHTPHFKDYCMTGFVDERQLTPVSIMEKFAAQLHIKGKFEKALKDYKEALRRQIEQEKIKDPVSQKITDIAGAAIESVPFAGGLLREGIKTTTSHLITQYQTTQIYRDAERLVFSIEELTRAFAEELNQLADTTVVFSSQRSEHQRRIIFFFDTFEQLANAAVPWLLDYFLPEKISSNVALVIAGRNPLEHSTSEDPKRWLEYYDDGIIHPITLNSFTEDETHSYLIKRGITDPVENAHIGQLSHGLPLYLSILTSNPQGKIDPTKKVIDNFLLWIPKNEQIKRQVALDAALFSRPFNQDDFEAFAYLSEQDRPAIYQWLIEHPFVLSKDGRYTYHDLVKDMFSRHLYQNSRKRYIATRTALVDYYKRLLDEICKKQGKEVYNSSEGLELVLALMRQLFLLPDEDSCLKGIEQVLSANEHTNKEQDEEIIRVLRELSQEQPSSHLSSQARQVIKQLLQYMDFGKSDQQHLEAITALIEHITHQRHSPLTIVGSLYLRRGWIHSKRKEYQLAGEDFTNVLVFDPNSVSAYNGRGWAYSWTRKYQQAIEDFNQALELDPNSVSAYNGRGWVSLWSHQYSQAMADFDYALKLDSTQAACYNGRGIINLRIGEYKQALFNFTRFVEVAPQNPLGYAQRGRTYIHLKEYQHALTELAQALKIDPNYERVYFQRGIAYLWLKDIGQAISNFMQSWELDRSVNSGLMVEWARMCQTQNYSMIQGRLEELIEGTKSGACYYLHVCKGVALFLREIYEEALAELEQAISPTSEPFDALFWKGMSCVSLKRDEEAVIALEKALKLGLPPILLAPLRWFEQDRPEFYKEHIVPLLAQYQ